MADRYWDREERRRAKTPAALGALGGFEPCARRRCRADRSLLFTGRLERAVRASRRCCRKDRRPVAASSSSSVPSAATGLDRESTRLKPCHTCISYAVFCLDKKFRDT